MTLDVHYLISGCGPSSNICRSSLSSPEEVGFGQEQDGGSEICSNPPPKTPLPLLLITSPLPACYAPLPTPTSFASISLQTDSLGDGGGGRGSWPYWCSHLARECVLCLCVCVCCPVLPLLLTLCQGVFFSFLQIGQKKMYVCVEIY